MQSVLEDQDFHSGRSKYPTEEIVPLTWDGNEPAGSWA
jgi:hypothetical protein